MSRQAPPIVRRQVSRAWRRLYLQQLFRSLLGSVAVALLLVGLWFPLARLLDLRDTWIWAVPAGLVGAGLVMGVIHSLLRRPSEVAASLALDERFQLRERVTTLLNLPADLLESGPGQVLAEETVGLVQEIRVGERFPLASGWRPVLGPIGAGALAVGLFFLAGFVGPFASSPTNRPTSLTAAKEVNEQLAHLKKVVQQPKNEEIPSEKLKELEEMLEKLANKPLDPNNRDQIRERAKEMKSLEDKMKQRAEEVKENIDRGKDMKSLLERLQKQEGQKLEKGPAKDLEDALAKGDLKKAQEILKKLAKQMEAKEMTPAEQQKLADDFRKLEEKLKRLLDQDDLKKQLEQAFKDGKIDEEQLQRELDRLKQERPDVPDLEELAELIGQCKSCLGRGDGVGAGKKLREALEKLEIVELSEEELKRLEQELQELEATRLALEGCDCDGNLNGLGQGKRPGGRRPIDPNDPEGKVVPQQQKVHVDPLGEHRITGFTKGGTFQKIPAKEVEGAFQRAQQEAPEALERQKIPADAANMARDYFKKLAGQKD